MFALSITLEPAKYASPAIGSNNMIASLLARPRFLSILTVFLDEVRPAKARVAAIGRHLPDLNQSSPTLVNVRRDALRVHLGDPRHRGVAQRRQISGRGVVLGLLG